MSAPEDLLAFQLKADRIVGWEREYKFDAKRKWRFDIAFPEHLFACEIEGGTWSGGRHSRGAGFEADCLKYEAAMLAGWTVYRVTPAMVKAGVALGTIKAMIA